MAALRYDYSRQTALSGVGLQGQERLRNAKVLVIGAGGLGVPVLSYLAGAGVGLLGVVDADVLDASNLHRQTIYSFADVGSPKADLIADRLRALNPDVRVLVFRERLNALNAKDLLRDFDIVVDCTDNFASKFAVNDAAVLAQKPAVLASVYQYEGQLQVYRPDIPGSACLRGLWPEVIEDGVVGNCQQAGVLGPVPGVLGNLQALEVLKIFLGLPGQLTSEVLLLDLLTFSTHRVKAPACKDCSKGHCVRIRPAAFGLETEEPDVHLDVSSLQEALNEGYILMDIREDNEVATFPIDREIAHEHIPMHTLLSNPMLDRGERYLLICATGKRSGGATRYLRQKGFHQVFSLRGGLTHDICSS